MATWRATSIPAWRRSSASAVKSRRSARTAASFPRGSRWDASPDSESAAFRRARARRHRRTRGDGRAQAGARPRQRLSGTHDSILLTLDSERRVREVNARGSELLGAPAQEILGRDWLRLHARRQRTRTRAARCSRARSRAAARASGNSTRVDRRRRAARGSTGVASHAARPTARRPAGCARAST